MAEQNDNQPRKQVFISLVQDGNVVFKTPVRSVEHVVGMSQCIDEKTSLIMAVE